MLLAISGAKIAGIAIVAGVGLSFLVLKLSTPDTVQSAKELGVKLDRRLLRPDLTVEDARRMVAEWEAMTDADRADLPDADKRGAEIRQIRKDLATYREWWDLEPDTD